jgi:hypothetical protein
MYVIEAQRHINIGRSKRCDEMREVALLLAAVLNQLNHIADLQMFVGPGNKGPSDPMIDRRRVPG